MMMMMMIPRSSNFGGQLSYLPCDVFRVGIRIGPLRFLIGCRKRRRNQEG